MKLSGRVRTLTVTSLVVAACGQPQALSKDHDRVIRMEAACKQFTGSVGWWHNGDLVEGEPQVILDDHAIQMMIEACKTFLKGRAGS